MFSLGWWGRAKIPVPVGSSLFDHGHTNLCGKSGSVVEVQYSDTIEKQRISDVFKFKIISYIWQISA